MAPACDRFPPRFSHRLTHRGSDIAGCPVAAGLGGARAALPGAARCLPTTGLAARVVGGNADVLGRVLLAHWHHGALWLHCGALEHTLLCRHRPGQWRAAGAVCVVAALDRALCESLVGAAGTASVHLCGVRLPVSACLPLVSGLFATPRATLYSACRCCWRAWRDVYAGGVQHRGGGLCPTSGTAGARGASPDGPGVRLPPIVARRVRALADAATHR